MKKLSLLIVLACALVMTGCAGGLNTGKPVREGIGAPLPGSYQEKKQTIAEQSAKTKAAMSAYTTKAAPVGADTFLISDSEAANATKKATLSSARAALGLGTADNPSFNSLHATGGNIAASNAQVTKKWISGLSYTANETSVIHGGHHYICTSSHTAGSTTEPGVGASWATVWILDSGSGATAINDLTDVDTTGWADGKILKFNSSGNLVVGVDNEGVGGGISHATSDGNYYASRNGAWASLTGLYAAALGADDNYVTDAEKVKLSNLSGTNTGDQVLPTDATISTSDVTTNNASTTKHGWLLKATAPASGLRNIVAIDNAETVYKNAALFDATSPSTQAFGDTAAVGTAMTSARRDHKHAMPAAPTTITGNAGTATALAANGTNCSAGQAALGVDASGNAEGCWSPSGASAAGSDTQVQFNDGGTSFGGDAGLTYNKTTDSLTVVGTVTAGNYASNCAGTGDCYSKSPNNSSAPASATVVNGFYTYGNELYGVENSGAASKLLMANDIGVSGGAQGYNANLTTYAGIAPSANVQSLLGAANYAAIKTLLDTDDIQTLTGITAGVAHLGTFTGTTIADNTTIKTALQSLETAVESASGGGLTTAQIDTSSELRTIVTDEKGTGPLLFDGFAATEVDGSAATTLTASQVSGTIVTNRGQAASDVALTLPTAAAGYNALFTVGTAQTNKWGVRAGTNDKIYLLAADGTISAGSDNGYARMTNAQVGQAFACWTFQTGASAWDWQCKASAIGTSTFAAN